MKRASNNWRHWGALVIITGTTFGFTSSGYGKGSRSNTPQAGIVSQTSSFGSLVPIGFGAPAIVTLPFHLSIPQGLAARGYRLSAASNFVFSPSQPAGGGRSISASDVGVGIAGISAASQPNTNMVLTPGFDYDPSVVKRAGGSSHYGGAAAGRANLADLLPGRDILRVGKMSPGMLAEGNVDLTLTFKLAVQPQFLTPGGFSGTITLTVAE